MSKVRIPELNAWFGQHNGVAALDTMVEYGVSRSAVYRMVDRGELISLQPAVFQSTRWPTGEMQLMTAACLRDPSIAIGFSTAARSWTFRSMPKDHLLHVVMPHGRSFALRAVVVHRSRRIDPIDIVERADGIRLTSPTRTLFDIADFAGDRAASSILEQLINDGRGTMATHAGTVARLGHAQRRGTATMARVIASRPAWSSAMQSDLETQVLAEFRRQGLPLPVIQHRLVLRDGRRIRFDFAWPELRIAVEVDHPFWHAGDIASHNDKQRDRLAMAQGWRIARITSLDVAGGLVAAVADVAAMIALAREAA